jgi:hypothetical protein
MISMARQIEEDGAEEATEGVEEVGVRRCWFVIFTAETKGTRPTNAPSPNRRKKKWRSNL